MISISDMGAVLALDHVSTAFHDRVLAGQRRPERRQSGRPRRAPLQSQVVARWSKSSL